MRPTPLLAACSLLALATLAAAQPVETARMSPIAPGSTATIPNRAPLEPAPFLKLPIGAIEPRGWLRTQLELEADGFIGHLPEISRWCKFDGNAWASPQGEGHSHWEELPYWFKGFGDLGYILNDPRIQAESKRWIEGVLASQEADGYFGPRENKHVNLGGTAGSVQKGKPDLWPHMVMINALQSYYEWSGDARVLPFLSKYFRWELSVPEEDFLLPYWQKLRAGDNLESIYWLYNRTGEAFLLEVAQKVHRRTADWTTGIEATDRGQAWHGVNLAQGFREPTIYWMQSKDLRHRDGAERNYQHLRDLYGQVPGGLYGADENCRPGYADPRQATETCSMVEIMHSFQLLVRATGNPIWADRCEDVALNSFPASMTADEKALHYLTAPNMVVCDRRTHSPGIQNGGNMLGFDPHDHRCCQHNVSHGWPYYAEHLWMATPGNGLAAMLYAACQVKAKVGAPGAAGTPVTITETTDYPFRDTVEFALATPAPVRFPLLLRIPGWCDGAKIAVNGQAVDVKATPLSFATIDREWKDGDKVTLTLPMTLNVTKWAKNRDAVSVNRGPLTYSLKIGEKLVRAGGTEAWPAWELLPTTPWNYGLALDANNPAAGIAVTVKDGPLPRQPFEAEAAPIQLTAKARKIPQWQIDHYGLCAPLQASPAFSDQPEETVTLIPMGCARLRISAFPTASTAADATRWVLPPKPPLASHCNGGDTTTALNDGKLPRTSNDHGLPRFTWWDHKGTKEWVAYEYDPPRTVSSAEVYWFDDTGGGGCRVPASWRLVYKDGDEFKPVKLTGGAPGSYGIALDKFNTVTFEPVTTTQLRLEVQLQEGFSGGILEWRVK